jgi:stage II sporulation protein P
VKYQSLWWKGAALVLALCLAVKLIVDIGLTGVLEKIANSRAILSSIIPGGSKADSGEDWTIKESAELSDKPETAAPSPEVTPIILEAMPENDLTSGYVLPKVKNYTSYNPDWNKLLKSGWSYTLTADFPQILIIHTHSCEAYTQDGANTYEASDPYRTLDKNQSVIRVGDELTEALNSQGFVVLHDRGVYDYPGYSGSYSRSLKAVEDWLEEYPTIRVVIDLHRDALDNGEKTYYEYDGKKAAQVMLLLTTGEAGLYHPNWKENLKLALELQIEMELLYSGLARPLCLSKERYNQQACPGSFLLEVGTNLNTLEEALEGVRLFAECSSNVFSRYIE